MRIGLISDTHIPDHAKELPEQVKGAFRGVDLILHGGDVYDVSVLDELEQIAPVLVAEGDDDREVLGDGRVKKAHLLTIEEVTILLIHERPYKWDGHEKHPGVIVFGDSHRSAVEKRDGVLFVNPGSATFPKYKHEPGTVAILTINSGTAEAEIVQL